MNEKDWEQLVSDMLRPTTDREYILYTSASMAEEFRRVVYKYYYENSAQTSNKQIKLFDED